MSTSGPHISHDTGRDLFTPGPATADDVEVYRMYYTSCQVCGGALNDWSETIAEAQRNRREHLARHKRSADQETAVEAAREKE